MSPLVGEVMSTEGESTAYSETHGEEELSVDRERTLDQRGDGKIPSRVRKRGTTRDRWRVQGGER